MSFTICEAHRDGRRCNQIANCTITLKNLSKEVRVCGMCADMLKREPQRIRLVFDAPFGSAGEVEIKVGKPKRYAESFSTDVVVDGKRRKLRVKQAPPEERN